jgi:hypothetical protein
MIWIAQEKEHAMQCNAMLSSIPLYNIIENLQTKFLCKYYIYIYIIGLALTSLTHVHFLHNKVLFLIITKEPFPITRIFFGRRNAPQPIQTSCVNAKESKDELLEQ